MNFYRNFYGKDNIIKLLNAMGELNMNQLHLRISDDEGWRIQILQLPELTKIGANRCYDPNVQYFLVHGPQSIRSHIMWPIYFRQENMSLICKVLKVNGRAKVDWNLNLKFNSGDFQILNGLSN